MIRSPGPRRTDGKSAIWIGRLAAIGVVCAALVALSAAPAEASGALNSQCAPGHNGFGIISSGGVWAQTFPANSSGKLLQVNLGNVARASGGSGGDIEVQLFGADPTGTPVAPVLASTTIPGASVTADDFYHDYSAQFDPASAAFLTSGKTYAVALSTADSAQNVWAFHDGDPCPGVGLFTGSPFSASGFDAGLTTYLAPANDDFERAQTLSGQNASADGTTAGATRQDPAEPDHYTTNPDDAGLWVGDHSVWYRWTAPNSGPTTIDTCTGQIDSILAVYTGSQLGSLSRVTDDNNDASCTADVYGSKVSFDAVGGTTYDIAVGDAGGARESTFSLRIVGAPDTTPPDTRIDSGPSGATNDASPSFAFSSEPGATFECSLDSAPFAACASPKSYSSLAAGAHVFQVRATDSAGNSDPTPAARSFTLAAAQVSPAVSPTVTAPVVSPHKKKPKRCGRHRHSRGGHAKSLRRKGCKRHR